MVASGPCSCNNTSVVVHSTNPGYARFWPEPHVACAAPRATSGAMQTSTGSTEYSLAHSRRGDIVCVGDKLDGEIARIHGAIIPFQPEMYLL